MSPHRLTRLRSRVPDSRPVRWALIGIVAATLGGSPLAIGAALGRGGGSQRVPLAAGARNPRAGVLLSSTRIIGRTSDETLKVSNSGPSGGAGMFTCASIAGGSAANRPPCLAAENRASGSVFEFTFKGPLGGVFQIGNDIDKQFPAVKPFVTNATGVATGLNADRVDGQHAQDIIDAAVERSSVQVGAQGPQGSQGVQGPRGPQGVQGAAGPPGTPLVAAPQTARNPTYADRRVVLLPALALSSTKPDDKGDGTDLLGGTNLAPLDPGTYIVQTTLRAYEQTSSAATERYALAGVFLDNDQVTTLTTPAVPTSSANAAQVSDTSVITVGTAVPGVLRFRGLLHGAATNSVTAGISVVITEVNPTS